MLVLLQRKIKQLAWENMKLSVFIPCIPRHVFYLPYVVEAYKSGTVQPDEIVVYLSGFSDVPKDQWERFIYYYPEIQYETNDILISGANAKQQAHKLCNTELIMYQDADDLPTKNRVEICKSIFMSHDIVHLNHSWVFMGEEIKLLPLKIISGQELYDRHFDSGGKIRMFGYGAQIWGNERDRNHDGALVITRETLKEVSFCTDMWKAADRSFCFDMLKHFKTKSAIINQQLYYYLNNSMWEQWKKENENA